MLTCRPGQICAYSRAEFLIKVEFLTRPFAGVALPAAGQATPERPTAAPYGRGARPPRAGRFVGLSGPQQLCPAPARPRAPLTACGGKARANNRGLAGKEKEAEPVMEEFGCGEKENPASSPRVSQKFNSDFPPLVVEL